MLTTKKLNAKRSRKEAKRAIKRRGLFTTKIQALKGRKMRMLREKAMKTIMQNPQLLKLFNENQAKTAQIESKTQE